MRNAQDNPAANPAAAAPASLRRRLFWLLACTAVGLGVGLLGNHFTSNPRWFLALPAALAAGWMFFANPAECTPDRGCKGE